MRENSTTPGIQQWTGVVSELGHTPLRAVASRQGIGWEMVGMWSLDGVKMMFMFEWPDLFLVLVGAGVVGLLLWRVYRPRYRVKIVLDESGVRHHQGLAQAQQQRVIGFLQEHIAAEGKLTIYVAREPSGRMRVDCRGAIDPGTQQQIRNFLMTVI